MAIQTNWDITTGNNNVANHNFYRGNPMAMISLSSEFVGVLGRWWVPVAHRDTFAEKVKDCFSDIPNAIVSVSFPLPDSSEGCELFPSYKDRRKAPVL